MSTRGNSSVTEVTLSKLADSINQYAASAITSLVVPEFRGSPEEDVKEFIGKFKTATITLSDEMKCLALSKALSGSAKIWAKENIKSNLLSGNWKAAKKLLKERFAALDSDLKNLEKLGKLKHDPGKETLISYLEKYSAYYKSAHKEAKDTDIIRSLKLNLPRNVIRGLNMVNDEWANLKEMKDLYVLARRVEDKILAYEDPEQSVSSTKAEDITKMLKEMKEILKHKQEAKEEPQQPSETVAAMSFPNNYQKYQRPYNNNQNFNRPRHYDQRSRQGYNNGARNHQSFQRPIYRKVYNQRRTDYPSKKLAIDNAPQNGAIEDKPRGTLNDRAAEASVIELYYKRYGKPPSPCQLCKGEHFNRHCPYRDLK